MVGEILVRVRSQGSGVGVQSWSWRVVGEILVRVRSRNRPLRVGATLGEATEPSEMRLSRSDQVWVSEANCEAAARPRASAEESGVGVQSWSWRVVGEILVRVRGGCKKRRPHLRTPPSASFVQAFLGA